MSEVKLVSGPAQTPVGLFEKALSADLTWLQRLSAAAQAGYGFVEISIDDSDERIARLDWGAQHRAELRQAVMETGIPILSMSLSAHRRFPLGSLSKEVRQTGLDLLKKAIDLAVDVGIRIVQVAGCDVYHEESTESTRQQFLDGLRQGIEWASSAGVLLALENWDVGVDSVHKAMWYVQHFNTPWFQHYVDLGNLAYRNYDVVAELAAGRGHIVAVHVKDALPGDLRHVPLGHGAVPFAEAFAALAGIGFQGPLVAALTTGNQPDAIEIAVSARRWVKDRIREGWQLAADRESARKGAMAEA
jgi:L-ribulose-5-phosphate 3-epimerase